MNSDDDSRIIHWLQTIRTQVKNPLILVVGTYLDAANEMKLDLVEIHKKMVDKTQVDPSQVVFVSCKSGENLDKLQELLVQNALKVPMIGETFPKMYLQLQYKIEGIAQTKSVPLTNWKEFGEIARSCDIVQEHQLKNSVTFLHELGFCLYFAEDEVGN